MGFSRQLTPDEIYEQVARFDSELKGKGERLSNVVVSLKDIGIISSVSTALSFVFQHYLLCALSSPSNIICPCFPFFTRYNSDDGNG